MKRIISLLLATLSLALGLSVISANANPLYPRFNGSRHSSSHVCLQDQTYGWYPSRVHTSISSWNGPADFAYTYRGPDTPGGIDVCTNGDFSAGNIVKVGLWPADRAYEVSWCVYTVAPQRAYDSFRGFYVYTTTAITYINFYRCQNDPMVNIADMNSDIGTLIGFIPEGLGTYYSVMNLSRNDIPYPTSNDLLRVNDRY